MEEPWKIQPSEGAQPKIVESEDGRVVAQFRTLADPADSESPLIIAQIALTDRPMFSEIFNYYPRTDEAIHISAVAGEPSAKGEEARNLLIARLTEVGYYVRPKLVR